VKTRDQTSSEEEGSSPSKDESEGGSEEGESKGEESDGESGVGLGDSEGEDGHSENSDDVPLPGWEKWTLRKHFLLFWLICD